MIKENVKDWMNKIMREVINDCTPDYNYFQEEGVTFRGINKCAELYEQKIIQIFDDIDNWIDNLSLTLSTKKPNHKLLSKQYTELKQRPYGIGAKNITNNKSRGGVTGFNGERRKKKVPAKEWKDNGEWDNSIPSAEHFKEMLRVSKNQIIFGGNYMTQYLNPSSCWIVWDKVNGDNDFADCELAWASFPKAVRKFKFRWNGMLQGNMKWKEQREHPTQKPIALGRWLLERYAKPNDLIFDPFAGSGSFLVACKQKGFNFVGCEINKEYVELANKRLRFTTVGDFLSPKGESLIIVSEKKSSGTV